MFLRLLPSETPALRTQSVHTEAQGFPQHVNLGVVPDTTSHNCPDSAKQTTESQPSRRRTSSSQHAWDVPPLTTKTCPQDPLSPGHRTTRVTLLSRVVQFSSPSADDEAKKLGTNWGVSLAERNGHTHRGPGIPALNTDTQIVTLSSEHTGGRSFLEWIL